MNRIHTLAVWLFAALAATHEASAQAAGGTAEPGRSPAGTPATAPNEATPDAAPLPAAPVERRAIAPDRAVREALAYNTALIAARLREEQAAEVARGELGRYPYVLGADAGYTTGMSPRLTQQDRIRTSSSSSITAGGGLRRTFPIGTIAELRLQGERFHNDVITAGAANLDNPTGYSASARASVTQPLLRGAGLRVGEASLRAARVGQEVARRTRERLTSELVRDVLLAYDELWYAQSALEIERAALATAERAQAEAEQRIASGALPRSDGLSFAQRTAEMEESVLSADVSRRSRALSLAALIGDIGTSPPELVAATPPRQYSRTPGQAELEKAIQDNSVELAVLEAELRLAKIRTETAGELSRPRLDLAGYVETEGISEAAGRAIERAGRLTWVTAHVGASFDVPLDRRAGRAERASAALGVHIAEQNLRSARVRIAGDAVSALLEERAAVERLVLAERTLEIARQAHEAARERFALGQGLALEVQQREDDVRRAALRASRARVDLAQLRTSLFHLSGQLLDDKRVDAR